MVFYLFVVTFCVVWPHFYRHGKSEALVEKYDMLVHLLRADLGSKVMLTHVSYFTRRIVLAIVCVYMNEQVIFQLMTIILVDMLAAIIQAGLNPLKSRRRNRQTLYDEVTLVLIIDMLVCCSDLISDSK
mmetsp:Transcript_21028/g.28291  ORF Transcript_21028/g.28291 Transcript_21028/m.28291 type:complete len:129 (-) Transcript_21028:42-428(-)